MESFPPIADYAFLSDCENNCLVAADGSVEWLCLPRPDSPSVFAAVLDRSAGTFRFGPANTHVPHHRRYVPGTMALETTWHTPGGWLVVTDVLTIGRIADDDERLSTFVRPPEDFAAEGLLLRIATCVGGSVEVIANCTPLFDYGQEVGRWSYVGADYKAMTAHSEALGDGLKIQGSFRLRTIGGRSYGRTTLADGQSAFVALTWSGGSVAGHEDADRRLRVTTGFWRDWLASGRFPDHPWRSYLERSALTLKGLSFAPTGAIMAAATTSLPETPGGTRNWDYRYTWIRDSAFMLRSLYHLGFEWEAFDYFVFVIGALTRGDKDGDHELQIMYGIGGERDLSEHTLDHLSGYGNARPVRVGNGAWNQRQNDVWGMLLDAVDTQVSRSAAQILAPTWERLAGLVDTAIARRNDPDQGIWEVRGEPEHFTASKVLCWVAAARGADLASRRGDHERAKRWQQAADDMKADILEHGIDSKGRFRQHYGNEELDASLLLIPILGFLEPDDPRVKATVISIADELTEDGLVLRYRVDTTDTGFEGKEGTFTICSFWLVTALAMIGETERARALCMKLLGLAGPLQLYGEEIDAASGEHLGNFPQAFTHLALIDAVSRLVAAESAQAEENQTTG